MEDKVVTLVTSPILPLSCPLMILTVSPFFIGIGVLSTLPFFVSG